MSNAMARLGIIGLASALMADGSLWERAHELARASEPAQTNTAPPTEPIVESRQVRRARERREAKGHYA